MEAPTNWTPYVVVWLVGLATILLTKYHLHRHRHKLNLPPGPKPWPIIGNFNLIGPLPHRSLHELSKKYGHVMMVHYGSVPVLVGSSVEMAKLFLRTYDVSFAGRPKISVGKYTAYNYSNIAWSQYSPYWKQARKICLMELFSAKRLDSYEYIRVEELNCMLRGIFNTDGAPIMLKDHQSTLNLNVISRMVLGKRYLDENINSIVTPNEFKKMIEEWFFLNGVLNIGDWIPCLKYLDIQGYVKRMKILAKKFDGFLEYVLDEHIARKDKEKDDWVPKDLVDVLLQVADDPTADVKLGRTGVKAFSQVCIYSGVWQMVILYVV